MFSVELSLWNTLLPTWDIRPSLLAVAIAAAAFQIVGFCLMTICLAFETNMAIGFHRVTQLDEIKEPFGGIPKEEKDKQEFYLLLRMYALVIQFHGVERTPAQNKSEQVDGQEALIDGRMLKQKDSFHRHLRLISRDRPRRQGTAPRPEPILRRHNGLSDG